MKQEDYYKEIEHLNIEHYTGEISYYSNAVLRKSEIVFLNNISKQSKILDLGCGSGRFSINAAKIGFKNVTGLDITPESINTCKKRSQEEKLCNTEFVVGDMSELPFDDNSFDYVFCPRFSINALGTFDRRKNAVKEMLRVCKLGNYVYIESFNKFYLGRGPLLLLKTLFNDFIRYIKIFYCKFFNKAYKGLLPGDIVYKSNKVLEASKGYAHLPTIFELIRIIPKSKKTRFKSILQIAGYMKYDFLKYFRYSIWIIIKND